MWIIKNRLTGEYDNRGISNRFSKVTRYGWSQLGHAKNHVAQNLNLLPCNLEWYMNADFIQLEESGKGDVIPVSEYISTCRKLKYGRFSEAYERLVSK